MPRSPTDATRFTATGPYAASSANVAVNSPNTSASISSGSQISFGESPPTGETPQQKIARLRAAAARAKLGKESQFDQVVRIGRVWADRAHRFTAMSLIGLTALSALVATAGITDMLLHNRKRRNEWLIEQRAKSAKELAQARIAQDDGRATEDQILLINQARARVEAEEAARNRPGMVKRTTNWLFSGLSTEEQKGGKLGAGVASAVASSQTYKEEVLGEREDKGVLQAVEESVEARRRTGEMVEEVMKPLGGPLDREAQRTASAVADASKSWTIWLTGR